MAIFPLMSRYAYAGGDALVKAYRLAVQLLLIVALPIAVFACFAATPLIQIAGGTAYSARFGHQLQHHDLVDPDRLCQLGDAIRADRRQPAALPDQGFHHRRRLHHLANLLFVPRYGSLAAVGDPDPGRAVALHPVRLGRAPLRGADALARVDRPADPRGHLNVIIIWTMNRAGMPLALGLLAGFLVYIATLVGPGHLPRRRFRGAAGAMPRWRPSRAEAQG